MSTKEIFETNSKANYYRRNEYTNKENISKIEDKSLISNEKNEIEKKTKMKKNIIRFIIVLLLLLINAFIIFFFLYYLINKYINEKKCNSGYFRPEDDEAYQKCKKCSIDNCERCIGNKTLDFCIKCENGYEPVYLNNIIKYCTSYNNIDCSQFDINSNECKVCHDGYFLAFYNETKKKCKKCSIDNCSKCFGSTLFYKCIACENGYFIPQDDESKQNCKKCSIQNCGECVGTKSLDMCISCLPDYVPKKENNIIINCTSN